jgi:hypothetical protein
LGIFLPATASGGFRGGNDPRWMFVLISKRFGFMESHGIRAPEWFRLPASVTVNSANLFLVLEAAALFVYVANRQHIRMFWSLPLPMVAVGRAGNPIPKPAGCIAGNRYAASC